MGAPLTDEGELGRRLSALAESLPATSGAGRRDAVRRRARAVRRRRSAAGALTAGGALAAVVLLAPLPGLTAAQRDGLLVPADAVATSAAAPRGRTVATFDFPDQGAVAEVVLPRDDVRAGEVARYVVRVRTERGRVGGVDLVFGDGRVTYLDGAPACTPGAGPTVVELWADHAYATPGRYVVRARPQVLTGCRDGRGLRSPGGTPGEAVVDVG